MILVWLYDTYVVLDGNPLILDDKLQCRKVHALSCWRTYLWSMVVSPWYFNLWFWTMVPRQKCVYVGELTFGPWWLVLGIIEPHDFGPLVLVIYGIDP